MGYARVATFHGTPGISIQTQTALYAAGSPIQLGIEFRAKDTSPAMEAIAGRLLEIFGKDAIYGIKDEKMSAGQFEIKILYKPRR